MAAAPEASMQLQPFLLDRWLATHSGRVAFNLGGSTGPHWTVGELLQLAGEGARQRLVESQLVYGSAPGSTGLREAIAEMQAVPVDRVLVVAGGSEALLHVFFHAAEPGANVVVPFPGFPPYDAMPESLGLEVRVYHLRREHEYRIDLDEVRRLIDANTKLLLVNSPHNPTGVTVSDEELDALHDLAAERNIQFVCDEVFHPIYHGRRTASAARLARATVIGDFSKAFALSGLRVGWLLEPDSDRRAAYLNAREYFSISNTTVGEFFAEVAVQHRDTVLGRTSEVATTNLRLLEQLINDHRLVLDWIRPMGGMTAFVRLTSGANARALCEAALHQGLLLTPGDCFGLPDYFRLGFGVGRAWFPQAMERLADLMFQERNGAISVLQSPSETDLPPDSTRRHAPGAP
jgi:aspartate/methionine/tyrosine aminotransferase